MTGALSKVKFWYFSQNTQNCFAYISATKYQAEAVSYSKQTAEYPLSPHIKTIALAFFSKEMSTKEKRMLNFINLESTPNFRRTVRTQDNA